MTAGRRRVGRDDGGRRSAGCDAGRAAVPAVMIAGAAPWAGTTAVTGTADWMSASVPVGSAEAAVLLEDAG
jgi:hypothetical protein